MQGFPLKEFYSSAIIFEEQSYADSAFILKEGKVEISVKKEEGIVLLAELHPVSIFGEMALLTKEKKRTATARAIGPVKVVEIDREAFDKMMAESPPIISAVLQGVTQRLIDTTSRIYPGYVDRREKQAQLPGGTERRGSGQPIKHGRIKIHLVQPGQMISREPLSGYKEVRQVTETQTDGVRVDYFDGEIEWFQNNTLVYVTGR